MSKRGRPFNITIENAFTKFNEPGFKEPRARCRYCKTIRAWQTSLLQKHLDKCGIYLSTCNEAERASIEKRQSTIVVPTIGLVRSSRIVRKLALSTYMANLSYRTWSNPWIIDALHDIHDKVKLPDRKALATSLLDEVYADTSAKVMPLITAATEVNLVMDESTNIQRNRIMNLCANIPTYGAFYIKSTALGSHSITAEWTATWFIDQALQLLEGDTSRLNSLVTDTCPTQRATWQLIKQDNRFKHVFFVPCQSHSLQLLIGDILRTPWFAEVFQQAHLIINCFVNSPLQLLRLREIMEEDNGKQIAFILSVLTRWGT